MVPVWGEPVRRWKADTVAACASAIAAIASAFVAAYALIFLSHQEDIAKQQVRATYESNLYSKQVDGFAALMTILNDLDKLIVTDIGYNPRLSYEQHYRNFVGDKIIDYKRLLTNGWKYIDQKQSQLLLATVQLALISPLSMRFTIR